MPHRLAAASREYLHCARTAEATDDGSVGRGLLSLQQQSWIFFWFLFLGLELPLAKRLLCLCLAVPEALAPSRSTCM